MFKVLNNIINRKLLYYLGYIIFILKNTFASDFFVDQEFSSDSLTFNTIQEAVNYAQPGDNIIVREGRYSEWVRIMGKRATDTAPITLKAFPGERVVIDGTVPIISDWEEYEHNGFSLYRTVLDSSEIAGIMGESFLGVWQLFINDRMMIPAQAINLKNPTDPTTGTGSNPETNTYWEAGGDFAGTDGVHPSNTTNQLADIDSPEEWCYIPYTNEIYIYSPDGLSPNGRDVRARVRDRVLNIGHKNDRSSHIIIDGIEVFASAIYLYYATNVSFLNCRFAYSTTARLSAGVSPERGNQIIMGGGPDKENKLWSECDSVVFRNCIFEYIDSEALIIRGSNYGTVENCYFHHINWSGGESVALRTQHAQYTNMRYITIDQNTSGGGFYPSHYNLIDHCLVSNVYSRRDAAGIQINTGMNEPVIRNTWVMDAPHINGIRFDGNPGGVLRKIHHTLSIRTSRGYRLKGDQHQVHHILGMSSGRQDISLPDYKFYGYQNPETGEVSSDPSLGWPIAPTGVGFNGNGNVNTVHRNSIGDEYECDRPTFLGCDEEQNTEYSLWHGNLRGNEKLIYELSNPEHYDYRPRKGSSLVDAGVVVEGINDGQDGSQMYVGDAPDIGPYEYGDNVYFIPGYRPPKPSFPIPPHHSTDVRPATILAWRYPWMSNENIIAEVRVTGPGFNLTESFEYPNNVLSGGFHPGGNYSWNVRVNGKIGGNWFFQVANRLEPDNDRSVPNGQSEILYPDQESLLTVSNTETAFMRFTVSADIDAFWGTRLNLYVEPFSPEGADVVIYQFDTSSWNERETAQNIGLLNRELGDPVDTLYNIQRDRYVQAALNNVVTSSGEYAFALTLLSNSGRAEFCSKENRSSVRPYMSFIPGQNDLGIIPTVPMDDSVLFVSDIQDSIVFAWDLSHGNYTGDMSFVLEISLPYPNDAGNIDSLKLQRSIDGTTVAIKKEELLSMMMGAGLIEASYDWQVMGIFGNETWPALTSHQLHLVIDDGDFEAIFPDSYKLHHNYPNPFNASTTIQYDLPAWSDIRLEIFDIRGRKINTLVKSIKPPGRHNVVWKGKDGLGRKAASGLYFVRLTASNPNTGKRSFYKNEKLTLVK